MKVKTTAENRKDVVKAMEEILNVKAKYQGPPSFGYKVGEYTVDRDGNVEHESEEAALTMQNELVARGFAEGETDRLNIGIPIEGFTAEGIKNLIYMIHSKQYLLEKAVGKEVFRISDKLVERLDAEENIPLEQVIQIAEEESIEGLAFGEDRIFFCGFPLNEDEARAYAELAACMAKTAKEAKRVSPKATIEENEKYYMRVWLVRIGLGGKDGKDTRKVFLSRLKGHTAFRTEEDKEKWNAMAEKVVYTGAIDAYFDYTLGNLEYRSVRFENEILDMPNFQGNAAVNYTDRETPWTRIIEHKWFEFGKDENGNDLPKTIISKEYSSEWKPGDEPYYPVNDKKNGELYQKYKALAEKEENIIFGGRLGEYKYYDMDAVIASALECARNQLY